MTEEQFVRAYADRWQALEACTKRAQKMEDFTTLVRFDSLYREAAGHLSYAQTHFPLSDTCRYLNTLVTQAHHGLYRHSGGAERGLRRLMLRGARAVWENGRFVLASVGLFVAFALYGYLVCRLAPQTAAAFLPAEYLNASPSGSGWDGTVMSSTIMVNNIRVSAIAFCAGITFGLGTVYILGVNAMMLGALAAHVTAAGWAVEFWALILPHGVWELFAICLSGAAGLRIGYALLRPGRFRRGDALVAAGRRAVALMGFVCVLLVLAGVVEGFFTPSEATTAAKLIFAGFTGVLLLCYLWAGRPSRDRPPHTPDRELIIDN
ncbi:MAG: stage II sporulation protein M [Oscillospiraceae bacterium]|jgi:uncharacterized membrane protein SpoIIM required for sporulation|nr:stage II sporulation protein M [Oscillospiraceae bacterium]